ncbi:FAD-dependent monooxygenase [Actinoalloteichus spitiensis]|uniref:FAD-dependent monooxygenase n=1 Tax=Actinoalloteichus spitiensis TaxID=252394 RepID=UPI0003646089|nr:FAD-dependent monooxygenase [Actinoalloteichus spitiensis]
MALDFTGTARRRAVVVGAGIAGLAAATRLRHIGWDVLVVERSPTRRSSGYLVNLTGPGYDAAERLGILPALGARDLGFLTSVLIRADGRRTFTVPPALAQGALGGRAVTAFRGDLEAALHAAAEGAAEFRFGTTVRAVHQDANGVQATLSDGGTVDADLLVGADGLHSGIRRLVFGPEADFRLDLRHVVGALPLDRVSREVPDRTSATFIGPGRTAAVINLGPGRSSAFFTYRCPDVDGELARGATESLTSAFGDLGGPVPDVLRQLGANPDLVYFDSVSQIVAESWSRGRVVLLGDAAWCVTLFAGRGAGLALAGADRLAAALSDHGDDVPAALRGWESSLRAEVRKRQSLARKGMSQYAPPTRAHVWARALAIRAIHLPGVRVLVQRAVRRANQ